MREKKPLRTDRIHANASVGTAEEKLAEIAGLPPDCAVRIVRKDGKKVRSDAKLKNLG